jgi:hypothetical protein
MKQFVKLGIVLAALLALFATVSAHEPRVVGNYHIALGWASEPAYTGLLNKVEIFISQEDPNAPTATPAAEAHDDDDEGGGTPVSGADETLKLEIGYGGKTKALKLSEDYETAGHYLADVIPTQAGDYTFHLTGKIGDTDVDETFNSADGKFSSVEPITDIQFP